ncbi:MAG: hypothetical protein NkDv07_0963 [Candidatus Improbicoccus devescovinae]|nr:MAG: hypothetical protein NkDv07_0963 [Candidatus Improbicoccus devescovinae]
MNQKLLLLFTNKYLILKILSSTNKNEIQEILSRRKMYFTDSEIDELISIILNIIKNVDSQNLQVLNEEELMRIHAGSSDKSRDDPSNDAVRLTPLEFIGRCLSFPVRSIFYTTGAVIASVPKGLVDGFYDSWQEWGQDHLRKKRKKL